MTSFSFTLLALVIALLFTSSYGATSVSYSVYSDLSCANMIASGNTPTSFFNTSGSSAGTGYLSACFSISGVSGAGYAVAGCSTPASTGMTVGVILLFTDSSCFTQTIGGWGQLNKIYTYYHIVYTIIEYNKTTQHIINKTIPILIISPSRILLTCYAM
jgi:hypothetical protein